MFDSHLHTMVESEDGSYTAYSKEYEEHYHSTKDGALHESLVKHVIPAFSALDDKDELNILDICFGLGFNTLATLYHMKKNNINKKVHIYSPELDGALIASLESFTYPEEFEGFEPIISALVRDGHYEDENFSVELYVGDARAYIQKLDIKFDIIYQDAFSPSVNPILWTKEYFARCVELLKEDGVITTYSIAFKIRRAMFENGLQLYLNEGEGYRTATIASRSELNTFVKVDMEHKIACNSEIQALSDSAL